MIAGGHKILRQFAENGLAIVMDAAGFAVHQRGGAHHLAAESIANGLMAKANAKNRDFARELADDVDRSEEHTSELQSPVHLVCLHSFPTRRSSDLNDSGWPQNPAAVCGKWSCYRDGCGWFCRASARGRAPPCRRKHSQWPDGQGKRQESGFCP